MSIDAAVSLGGRRWLLAEPEPRLTAALAQRLGLPEIVARLLAARGIGMDTAADFLTPKLRALMPDPSLLTDMDAAAERLAQAAQRRELVAIFGDYDVDGACAGALMAQVLRALGCSVINYVPDRLTEGYGPNGPRPARPGRPRRAAGGCAWIAAPPPVPRWKLCATAPRWWCWTTTRATTCRRRWRW